MAYSFAVQKSETTARKAGHFANLKINGTEVGEARLFRLKSWSLAPYFNTISILQHFPPTLQLYRRSSSHTPSMYVRMPCTLVKYATKGPDSNHRVQTFERYTMIKHEILIKFNKLWFFRPQQRHLRDYKEYTTEVFPGLNIASVYYNRRPKLYVYPSTEQPIGVFGKSHAEFGRWASMTTG